MALYIGLMSGTSLDGVDGLLAEWPDETGCGTARPVERAFVHQDFAPALRQELLDLNRSGADELHRSALAANGVATCYAQATGALLAQAGVGACDVAAVGAHGQTVRHRPQEFDGTGYTVQLLNGALLAERCGMSVVCDFRARDVAAGGQGAPLVPAFHAAVFAERGADVAVLNIGGIANLTVLAADGAVLGFDTGPGNMLMDDWIARQRGQPYDRDGTWAATGRVLRPMLGSCLADPFFGRAPPKSTGRDLFDAAWLAGKLPSDATPADVMATLAELTVQGAVASIRRYAPSTARLYVCGGGAYNAHLMRRLALHLEAQTHVCSTQVLGVAPERVEALAFAWLARMYCARLPGNVPAVTGAAGPRVLGAFYPAN